MKLSLVDIEVDFSLLREQARIVGSVVDGTPITDAEREQLEGIWEFLHTILDEEGK